jgi:hypothetical protein
MQCPPGPSMDPQERSSTDLWLSQPANGRQMGQQKVQQDSQGQRQQAGVYSHPFGSIIQSNIGYGSATQSQSPGTSYTGPTPKQQAINRPAIQSQTTSSYASFDSGITPQQPTSRGSFHRAMCNRKHK